MPRQPRYDLPDYPQNVDSAGNNRQAVFFDVSDYDRYLGDLHEVAEIILLAAHHLCMVSSGCRPS